MSSINTKAASMRCFNAAFVAGVFNAPRSVHVFTLAVVGAERGIVGYWRLNEGPGAMVFDHSKCAAG